MEIYKYKNDKEVNFNLKYFPVTGVTQELVEVDIADTDIRLNNDTVIYTSNYNFTVTDVVVEKENFEEATMTSKAKVLLTGDLFDITATMFMEYGFDRGSWELRDYQATEIETKYAEGKDLVFSIDDLLNEYNRGRVNIGLVGNTQIYPLISKETLTESGVELIDLYTKRVVLDLNHRTPFYDLTGKVYADYRLQNDGWELSRVESEPEYKFKLEGSYEGWYEIPASWGSEAKRNNATLEISKVRDATGDYEGIFKFQAEVAGEDDGSSVVEGSYYVMGKYLPSRDEELDKWSMRSEKWIDQPQNFSYKNLSGVVDYEGSMFKGDILSYSDTFELKKVK